MAMIVNELVSEGRSFLVVEQKVESASRSARTGNRETVSERERERKSYTLMYHPLLVGYCESASMRMGVGTLRRRPNRESLFTNIK